MLLVNLALLVQVQRVQRALREVLAQQVLLVHLAQPVRPVRLALLD